MKKTFIVFFVVTVVIQTFGQNARPDVIASSGEFFSNSSNSISWTSGECVSEIFSNSGNKLTQCFQQCIYNVNTNVDYTENLITINLFPKCYCGFC